MTTGDRMRRARKLRGMTLKDVGTALGFKESCADVRMAQYESSSRCPRANLLNKLADVLGVSEKYLTGPKNYSADGVLRTLFEMETAGINMKIRKQNGTVAIEFSDDVLIRFLTEWKEINRRYRDGRLSKKEYELWKMCWNGSTENTIDMAV